MTSSAVVMPARADAPEMAYTVDDFRAIAAMIQADAGIHLPPSKATLVYSRLVKRLRALHLSNFQDYRALLESAAGEPERVEMLCALTTNVTRFYRERHHFDHLEREVLPGLMARARDGARVRLWSAACSTGQEAYSIALSVLAVEPQAARYDVRVLATDIDPHVVAEGRAGVYPDAALADVPAPARARHFKAQGEGFAVDHDLRALVSFRALNLNGPWPMSGIFDAVFCRNVAIYFDEPTQRALWRRVADQMAPGGWLYIGHSERVDDAAGAMLATAGVTTYRRTGASRA